MRMVLYLRKWWWLLEGNEPGVDGEFKVLGATKNIYYVVLD